MSDLRFFADTMLAAITAERRIREIEANAADYAQRCSEIRAANLPRRPGSFGQAAFDQASEGINAARIILNGRRA